MADVVAVPASQSPQQPFATVASPLHTIVLLAILTAISVVGYFSMHGAGPAPLTGHLRFYLPTITWEWLVFGYIYWGVRRHGKTFRDIAGERWKSAGSVLLDIAIAFCAWIVAIIVLGVTAKLLHATGSLEMAKRLAPQGVVESVAWISLSVTAGICEETIFRGYFQRQFVAWFRNIPAGVVLSAMLFGAGHIYQGWRSAVVIAVFGLLFGILAEARRNIRPGILLHAWQDGISGFLVRLASRALPK